MSSLTLKATVAQVPFGNRSIEGLLLETGKFAIAISQVASLNLIPPNRSLKQLEILLGMVFQSHQKAKTSLHPKAVNIISLLDFEKLLAKLDRSGNTTAQALRDMLVGLSLQQIFCDAFGVTFEAAERQAWLKNRILGKVTRREFTDSVKDWLVNNPEVSDNTRKFLYSNCSEAVNRALFGSTAKKLVSDRGYPEGSPTRDCLTDKELHQLDRIEGFAMKLIDKHNTYPLEAVKDALEFFS